MKFTLSWLKEYLDTDYSLNDIVFRLNEIGLEVDDVIDNSKIYKDFNCVIVEECLNHPDSDHLHICKVKNNNNEILNIVCGAPNVRVGLKTILAPVGSILPSGFSIKSTKIRGIESCGMLCSLKELNLGEEHDGIIELSDNINVGDNILDIFNLNDPVIDISITPNKGDCLSVYGIARDLACAGMGKLKSFTKINVNESFDSKILLSVRDENCPFFSFREINNIKNCESPEWLKNRLRSIDINPKNALVDITNYVMFCFGIPLHCYDKDKINGNINIIPSIEGEEFIDLFENKYKLNKGATLIKDDKKNLCLGGIIGSINSGSSLETKSIILECAIFDEINTARTSRILNIQSDAKYRFERGIDYDAKNFVLDFASNLIKEICGGEFSSTVSYEDENYFNKITRSIDFDYECIEKIIGIKIEKNKVNDILINLGYILNGKQVVVPHHKNNIFVKEDIVDDIIRIYGYDKLKNEDFLDSNIFEKDGNSLIKKINDKLYSVREILVCNGYTELITYSFLNEKYDSHFAETINELKLLNPITIDLSYMRRSLITNILSIIKKNNNRGFNNLSFFEIGHVFNKAEIDNESNILTCIRSGSNKEKDIFGDSRKFDVFDIKKDLFDVLKVFNINAEKMQIETKVPIYYHPNRSGSLYMGKTLIAYFGELHPNINNVFDIKNKLLTLELFLDNLPKKLFLDDNRNSSFKINDLQSIKRDLAFFLPNDTKVGELIKNIYNIDKNFITDVHLFDLYLDEKISNQKSIAFTVTIQPKNENMNKEDIDCIINKIIVYISKEYNGNLRDK